MQFHFTIYFLNHPQKGQYKIVKNNMENFYYFYASETGIPDVHFPQQARKMWDTLIAEGYNYNGSPYYSNNWWDNEPKTDQARHCTQSV